MKDINKIKVEALKELNDVEISIHCWQTDDVAGFELSTELSGGIQSTGNYLGKANNKDQVMKDLEFVLQNLAGKFRLNLHACYLISEDNKDRDEISYDDFSEWVEFAKRNNVKLDFNPTFFSHPNADSGYTLSSTDEEIRTFWVKHGQKSLQIAERMAKELNDICVFNIWIPDGCKEVPTNRLVHRQQLAKSLDEIIAIDYDKDLVPVAVESKVFGIGVESFTVGSHEFYMNYAATRNINCLVDMGHYHPTENVADKLSSLLVFNDRVALHLTRPVRWDSDHVIIRNDEIQGVCDEIIRLGKEKFYIGLDFFDGSINRTFAYISGIRNTQKAFLRAILNEKMHDSKEISANSYDLLKYEFLRDDFDINGIWNEYCETNNVASDVEVIKVIEDYEKNVLEAR